MDPAFEKKAGQFTGGAPPRFAQEEDWHETWWRPVPAKNGVYFGKRG